MKKFTKAALFGSVIAVAAALTLTAAPAQAAGEFGSLVTINPTGGTSESDGLKIEIAGGQLQIFRGGNEQLYSGSPSPDASNNCDMYNYFHVAIAATENKIVGCDPGYSSQGPSSNLVSWASGTITSNLTNGDKDGNVTLTLVSNEVATGKTITLQIVYTYTYPNPYVDQQATLTVPSGIPGFTSAKLYWNVDATLGGSDAGDQISGNLADGSAITGVVAADGSAIEAFNQLPGQTMQSWAGGYTCPWNNDQSPATECPNSTGAWVYNGSNLSAGISTDQDIDNGWGVQAPDATSAGTSVNSWRAYFVSCLNSSLTALQCIDESTKPKLPDTGADASSAWGIAGGAAALAAAGAVLMVMRRRQRA